MKKIFSIIAILSLLFCVFSIFKFVNSLDRAKNAYKPVLFKEVSLKDKDKTYKFNYEHRFEDRYVAELWMLPNSKWTKEFAFNKDFNFKLEARVLNDDKEIYNKTVEGSIPASISRRGLSYSLAYYDHHKQTPKSYTLYLTILRPENSSFYEKSKIRIISTSYKGQMGADLATFFFLMWIIASLIVAIIFFLLSRIKFNK